MSKLGTLQSVERNCSTCRHYVRTDITQGECVRYPPTVMVIMSPEGNPGTMSVFPPTQAKHRCGEWAAAPMTSRPLDPAKQFGLDVREARPFA